MSSPLEYTISMVESEDEFPAIATIENQAFQSSPLMGVMMGPFDLNSSASHLAHVWKTDPDSRFMKACLPNGQIIGFAKWNFLSPPGPHNPFPTEFPEKGRPELCKWFFEELARVMNEKMEGKKFVYMHILAIDPAYQRMGIGRRLLDWGLKIADEEGLEAYIDASPEGKGLYEKCGWQTINTIDLDIGKWGGPNEISLSYNMWRPVVAKSG